MFDKFFLYLFAAVEIQMKIDGCGLDVVMAQVVSDICEAMAAQEHVDRPRVAEAVNGIYRFKAFWRQSPGEVFAADAIDAVAGEFFPALVDKEAIFIRGLWRCAVFFDVEFEQLGCFGFKLYESESIAFSQDGQAILLSIEVIELKGCDFTGPGP